MIFRSQMALQSAQQATPSILRPYFVTASSLHIVCTWVYRVRAILMHTLQQLYGSIFGRQKRLGSTSGMQQLFHTNNSLQDLNHIKVSLGWHQKCIIMTEYVIINNTITKTTEEITAPKLNTSPTGYCPSLHRGFTKYISFFYWTGKTFVPFSI